MTTHTTLKGVVLVGPYYAGKTSCSRVISRHTGWKVFDLDEKKTVKRSPKVLTFGSASEDATAVRPWSFTFGYIDFNTGFLFRLK